jgi:hypothetical protein
MPVNRKGKNVNLKNHINDYQSKYPAFDRTPKAVIAAIAVSLAMRLSGDDFIKASQLVAEEWEILHANGIIPQRPIKA